MRIICIIIVLLAGAGCSFSPIHQVEVDALSRIDPQVPKTYVLVSGDPAISENDIRFQEFAEYVRRAMWSRGYDEVGPQAPPSYVVAMDYGISEPIETVSTKQVARYGEVGVKKETTEGSTTKSGNTETYKETTEYEPQTGIIGYDTVTEHHVSYEKFLTLTAYSWKDHVMGRTDYQVWTLDVVSEGASSDLRHVFPVLAAAARNYIGTASAGKERFSIQEDDPTVLRIRGVTTEGQGGF